MCFAQRPFLNVKSPGGQNGGQAILRREADNSAHTCVEERSGGDEKRADALLHE